MTFMRWAGFRLPVCAQRRDCRNGANCIHIFRPGTESYQREELGISQQTSVNLQFELSVSCRSSLMWVRRQKRGQIPSLKTPRASCRTDTQHEPRTLSRRGSPLSGTSSSCPAAGRSSRTGQRIRWRPWPAGPELSGSSPPAAPC